MSLFEIIILSIIQGITEFLPVSSSGHLVIAERLFGLVNAESNLLMTIMLHLSSLIAIFIFFFNDIFRTLFKDFRTLFFVIVGTIPAGLLGYLFAHQIEALFSKPLIVGIALMVTGVYLLIAEWHWKASPKTLDRASLLEVIAVGIAQAFAIMPGLSRSGLTIATGMLNGWDRHSSIKFSFLLAIPVMLGAAVLKLKDFSKLSTTIPPIHILIGFAICLVVSLLSIVLLVRLVRRGHLSYFGFYCLAVGTLVVIFVR